jgi:hypothetical protein
MDFKFENLTKNLILPPVKKIINLTTNSTPKKPSKIIKNIISMSKKVSKKGESFRITETITRK